MTENFTEMMRNRQIKWLNEAYPKIIRYSSKHETEYKVVNNLDEFKEACIDLLIALKIDDHLIKLDISDFKTFFKEETDLSLESFDEILAILGNDVELAEENKTGLITGIFAYPVTQETKENVKKQFAQRVYDNKVVDMAEKAIEEKDGLLAYKVLKRTYVYETDQIEFIDYAVVY